MKKGALSLFVILFAVPIASAEVKVTPVANVTLLGGQYWVAGAEPDSFGGNFDVFFSPVVNFSPRTALLPIYTGYYSGTKDVQELVGGGTITREMQDHMLSLKFVEKITPELKLKARVGYKIEYLKETRDETWGKGLFDYRKMIGGLEAERTSGNGTWRAGVDYYTMHYPNYQSLVSKDEFGASIDTTTYREISAQAGKDVLDYAAYSLFLERARAFSPRVTGMARYDVSLKNFGDQKTVRQNGEFSGTLRQDAVHYLTLGMRFAAPRVVLGLSDVVQYYDSNQNSFDFANSRYVARYYNYYENAVSPSVTFLLGSLDRPTALAFSWNLAWRQYTDRPAQYADATPKDQKISQVTNTTGFSVTYPLAPALSAKLVANYRDASSNMRYEKNYTYNYYTFTYFMGISWEM